MTTIAREEEVVVHDGPSWWSRLIVFGIIGAIVFCVLGNFEAWPLSGFKLFSYRRTGSERIYGVDLVRSDGTGSAYPFGRLPIADQNVRWIIPTFAQQSEAQRNAVCTVWRNDANKLKLSYSHLELFTALDHHSFDGSTTQVSYQVVGEC